jgi:hypothetical protein
VSESEVAALLALIPPATRLIEGIANGTMKNPADVARAALGIGLAAVPRAELIAYLTEEAREDGELAADIAERAKWPNG